MKKIRSFFLFRTDCETRKPLFWLWNWFCLLAAGAVVGLLSLLLAFGHYPWGIFKGYFHHPLILLLNLLPVLLLIALLYCITNRTWLAYLLTAIPVLLASAGNYFKLLFRDDPFIFADATAISTALKVSVNYDLSIDSRLALCILALLFGTLFLFLFARGRIRTRWRIGVLVVLLLSVLPLSRVYLSENIYNNKTQNYEFANRWSSTQVYISRGFLYPFLHSIPDAFPEKPDGYSDKAAREILSAYRAQDIPADKKVNIIGIQLEAFNDLERMGFTGISEEVYAQYHALEAESYTGNLVTNIFAGGTIDSERCFLTGYAALDNFRSDTGSYVQYLRRQGYVTEGSHSCYDWFYNRKNVNAYLGFDRYYFYENRYSELANRRIALDDILIPDILALYQARDPSVPYFNFSVTYQGHGPYTTTGLDWGDGYWTGEYSDETTYYIMNNYLGSVQNTAENLTALVDALREDDAPVVLLVFGDHNPWMGDSNSVYNELNIHLDLSTEEGFYNYFTTRYMIWANDAAKEALGNNFTGEGPDVSPCYLMNLLFEQCGWEGSEYMQLADEVMADVPVVHSWGYFVEDGALTKSLSPEAAAQVQRLEIAQYYRKRHPEW